MNALKQQIVETSEKYLPVPDAPVEPWMDDEFFDNIADIINENYVLEAEALSKLKR